MPKLGTLVDQMGRLRDQKRAAEAKAKEISQKLNAKEQELHQAMKDEGVNEAAGNLFKVKRNKKTHASVVDWNKLYAYISRTKSWDLLQRRVSDKAFVDRYEAGKKVAGVEPFTKYSLSLTNR